MVVISALAACNSHPLGLRKPQVTTINPPSEDAMPGITPDGGAPDVGPDVGLRVPDAIDAVKIPADARDLAAQPYDTRVDVPDIGATNALELLSWVQSVGGTPIRVLKNGTYVYLGDWANKAGGGPGTFDDGSLQTYLVTDPLLPVLKNTLFTPGHEMQDLAIVRRWLFAANDAHGLRLVDIGWPESLQSLDNRGRTSSTGASLYATSVAVTTRAAGSERQDYALVGYLYGGGLDIHLVPEGGPIPDPIHYTSTALPTRCDIHQIQVKGDRAFLLASNGSNQMFVEILDLSPLPALPTVLGRLSLPMASHGGIGDIRLSGDLLYFSASEVTGASPHAGGLRIISVADASNPTLVGTLDLPLGNIPWKGTGLTVAGTQVFTMSPQGVLLIDVGKPASPSLQGLTPYPSAFGTCQGGTAVADADLLYVGAYCEPPNGQGGLAIYRRR